MATDWQPISPDEYKLLFERSLDEIADPTQVGFADLDTPAVSPSSSRNLGALRARHVALLAIASALLISVGVYLALADRSGPSTPTAAPALEKSARRLGSVTETTTPPVDPATSQLPEEPRDAASQLGRLTPSSHAIHASPRDVPRVESPGRPPIPDEEGSSISAPIAPTTPTDTTTTAAAPVTPTTSTDTTTTAAAPVTPTTSTDTTPTDTTATPVAPTTPTGAPRPTTSTTSPANTSTPRNTGSTAPLTPISTATSTTRVPTSSTTVLVTTDSPTTVAAACHPAYSGGCVPFATDVDCTKRGGGKGGNGPVFVSGPITVVDPDVDPYKLDPDGDGIACDK